MSPKARSVSFRFIKGFIAGGVGSVLALLSTGMFRTVDDLKAAQFSIVLAFLVGGGLAAQKMWSWVDIQENEKQIEPV